MTLHFSGIFVKKLLVANSIPSIVVNEVMKLMHYSIHKQHNKKLEMYGLGVLEKLEGEFLGLSHFLQTFHDVHHLQ